MDTDPNALFRNYNQFDDGVNYRFSSTPVETPPPEPIPLSYVSETPADPLCNFDPSPEDVRNSSQSILDVESVKETEAPDNNAERNIVAAWADEYYRMTHQKHAEMVQLHNQQIPQNVRRSETVPPYDFSQVLKRNPPINVNNIPQEGLPARMIPVPTTVTGLNSDSEKLYKCTVCNTLYKTPARLKRHFSTKKHRSMSEIISQVDPNAPLPTVVTTPKSTAQPPKTSNSNTSKRGNSQNTQSQVASNATLPKFSTAFNQQQQQQQQQQPPQQQQQQQQQQQPPTETPTYLPPPPYRNYGESALTSVTYPTYPHDWSVFHGHLDYVRNSQNLYSSSTEPQSGYPYPQAHYNPESYYNKVTYGSLCNSHQSAFNQVQSPQRISTESSVPLSAPQSDQSARSYSYPPNYYTLQNPNSWYYPPHYPYPNPNQVIYQRSAQNYSAPVTTIPYQKESNNNNYLPEDQPEETRQVIFDQRPYQQNQQSAHWNPNTPAHTPEGSNGDYMEDAGSETISPAESPDSRNEAVVTSTESTEGLIPAPVTSFAENYSSEEGGNEEEKREDDEEEEVVGCEGEEEEEDDEDEDVIEGKRDGDDESGNFSNSNSNPIVKQTTLPARERPFRSVLRSKRITKKSAVMQSSSRRSKEDDMRRFKCDSCDMRFRLKNDLRRHQVSHTGEVLHRCNLCSKNFARKDHLSRHLIMHKDTQRLTQSH